MRRGDEDVATMIWGVGKAWVAVVVSCAALGFIVLAPTIALAQSVEDLSLELATIQADAAAAQAEIDAAEVEAEAAARQFEPIDRRADKAEARAQSASDQASEVEEELVAEREAAAAEVEAAQAGNEDELDRSDRSNELGLGLGIGLLLLVGIALAWERIRELAPLRRLCETPLFRFAAIVGASALLGLVLAALLSGSTGIARILAGLLFVLAIGIALMLIWLRHSLAVEADEGQPLYWRHRAPRWTALLLALLLAFFALVSIIGAATGEESEPPVLAKETLRLAEQAEDDPTEPVTPLLAAAQRKATEAEQAAEKLDDARDEAAAVYQEARSQLTKAQGRLRQASNRAEQLTRKIGELERDAALAAARAQRAAEREAARAAAAAPPAPSLPSAPASCGGGATDIPVPPGSPLDGDGDGIGCES